MSCEQFWETLVLVRSVKLTMAKNSKNWSVAAKTLCTLSLLYDIQVEKVVNEFAMHLVHGSTYHPQSQGSVERANGLFKVGDFP